MGEVMLTQGQSLFNLLVFITFSITGLYLLMRHKTFIDFLMAKKLGIKGQIVVIIVAGILIILASQYAVVVAGARVNVRDCIAIFAGMLGGPVAGISVGLIGGIHRMSLGGWTAIPCGLATIVAGFIGAWLYEPRWRKIMIPAVAIGVGFAGGIYRYSIGMEWWGVAICVLFVMFAGFLCIKSAKEGYRIKNMTTRQIGIVALITGIWECIHIDVFAPFLGGKATVEAFSILTTHFLFPMVTINVLGILTFLFVCREATIVRQQAMKLKQSHDELEQRVEERTKQLALFSQSVHSSIDGVGIGGLDRRITYVNDAFVSMFGYTKEELIGQRIAFIYAEDYVPKLEDEVLTATVDEGGWTGELIGRRKNGELFPMMVSASRVEDEEGNVIALMANHRDITRVKRAEEALEYIVEFEKRIATISTYFINLAPDEIDGGINYALQIIGEFAGVDHSYVFMLSGDGTKLDNTHEWCADGIEGQIENQKGVPAESLPWFMAKLNRFETIHIPRVADLPPGANAERDFLEPQGVQSLIIVPMAYSGVLTGFIGFDSILMEKTWSEESIALFPVLDEIFVNTLERKRAENDLQEVRERLTVTLKSIGDGVIATDTEGRITLMNDVAQELTGWNIDEAAGHSSHEIFNVINKETREAIEDPIMKVLRSGNVVGPGNHSVLIAKDGTERAIADSGAPIKGSDGISIGVVLVFRDVTEQRKVEKEREVLIHDFGETNKSLEQQAKELEEAREATVNIAYDLDVTLIEAAKSNDKLEELTLKLERSNKDLQDFAYIVSHDLKAPVRKVAMFGELLTESLTGKLDEDEQENFEFMIEGATRMQQLIDALLTYSRVQTKAKPQQQVDLNEVVEDLRDMELALPLEEAGGVIEVPEPLPTVHADPSQMHQLMQNLIGNGLKYYREGVPPVITVRGKEDGNMVRIEVQDNGIGIGEEHYEKVFRMFQRLHTDDEYEGTGVGLAVCKRIVERHGGEIGVVSTPGEGSRFWFTMHGGER